MAGETQITVVGNLTADPELRTLANGSAVASFTIASTPRTYDRNANEWKDGNALFLRCSAWNSNYNPMAENINVSLKKGMRVVAQGSLNQRSYTAQDGTDRTVYELTVSEIGPALSRQSADVVRSTGDAAQSGSRGGSNFAPAQAPAAAAKPAGDDPWAKEFDGSDLTDPNELPF